MELFTPPPRILLDAMLSPETLERFIDEFGDRAYGFAYGLCGNEAEARELTQEAFVRVFEHAAEFDETRSLESWFLTVLKNVFRDGLRRWDRRRGQSLDAPIGETGMTLADAIPDAREEALLDRLERRESA